MSNATIAKLLLVALSFCWGLSWTAMRVALDEVSPWGMRLIGYSIGAATLLAYFVLRERINARAALGLALCVAGLSVLVYPVAETSLREPVGLLLALVCALGWGGGTVYMKWARIKGD